jgi:hypothetical protein
MSTKFLKSSSSSQAGKKEVKANGKGKYVDCKEKRAAKKEDEET